jgi:ankyrin repeat protein
MSRIALSCPHNEKMVDWLIEHGADPNAACDLDLTPMSYAMTDAPLAMIDELFSKGANVHRGQLLHHAVLRKNNALELVQKLVTAGAPINEVKYEKDPKSYNKRVVFGLGTPLHRAAEFNKTDIVEYLLSMGADPLKLDSEKCTPRFWATKWGHTQVATMLEAAERTV